jgi:hypothetical protein
MVITERKLVINSYTLTTFNIRLKYLEGGKNALSRTVKCLIYITLITLVLTGLQDLGCG